MSEHSKIEGVAVNARQGSAAGEADTVIAFLEQLRAAWDLKRSSLYAANRSELQDAARPWKQMA